MHFSIQYIDSHLLSHPQMYSRINSELQIPRKSRNSVLSYWNLNGTRTMSSTQRNIVSRQWLFPEGPILSDITMELNPYFCIYLQRFYFHIFLSSEHDTTTSLEISDIICSGYLWQWKFSIFYSVWQKLRWNGKSCNLRVQSKFWGLKMNILYIMQFWHEWKISIMKNSIFIMASALRSMRNYKVHEEMKVLLSFIIFTITLRIGVSPKESELHESFGVNVPYWLVFFTLEVQLIP